MVNLFQPLMSFTENTKEQRKNLCHTDIMIYLCGFTNGVQLRCISKNMWMFLPFSTLRF